MKDINLKVQQLKSSFSVESVPLVKSNRFTDEEIAEMKKNSSAHSSHWNRLSKTAKTYTDEEIKTQIEVFFETPMISEVKFKSVVDAALKALPIKDIENERNLYKEIIFGILGWTEDRNGLSPMWAPFGSAPSNPDGSLHGEKLQALQKKYGACSMGTVFDGQFSDKFHLFWYSVNAALHQFETYWKEAKKKKDIKESTVSSPYKDLNDIEENVVMKKIEEAAKEFYLDKTKDFDERIKVFNKYGKKDTCIFRTSDRDLSKIFDVYFENDIDRHQTVTCTDVVWYWIDYLRRCRCHLNWTNPYHPKIDKGNRNYKPSQEAIDRLYRFYVEKLFLEGVGSFEFDW
jgi:hypothetical protein